MNEVAHVTCKNLNDVGLENCWIFRTHLKYPSDGIDLFAFTCYRADMTNNDKLLKRLTRRYRYFAILSKGSGMDIVGSNQCKP